METKQVGLLVKVWALARLYRADAALIAFFAYLAGAQLSGGFEVAVDLLAAFLVSAVSMNFIYSFNSWADRAEDAINKPWRSIPSGQLSEAGALRYTMVLLALSIIYPLILWRSPLTLGLFYLLPLLGLLYSAPPRLKRNPITAAITTSVILVTPMVLGYAMHSADASIAPFFGGLFGFCLGAIPLKDIEDEEGDVATGLGNWFARLGPRKLLGYSAVVMIADLIYVTLMPIAMAQKLFLWAFAGGGLATLLVFMAFKLAPDKIYRTIIRVVIVSGVAIFVLQRTGVV